MSDYVTDYPPRMWVALGPDMAAGYARDVLGDYRLFGLVIYGPTTEKLRGARLRGFEHPPADCLPIRQDDPPGPELVANEWEATRRQQELKDLRREVAEESEDWRRLKARISGARATAEELASATAAGELQRRPDDGPDDFYRRVTRAHAVLARITDKPTAELARRAGVPVGTAAAWVSRARTRGLYEDRAEGGK